MKDTAGVKKIRFDEDIRRIFCSKNICPFGYIAILGKTKLSIYLAYADEAVAMYDLQWILNQWDLRLNAAGTKIDLLDFSSDGNSFITLSASGEIAEWDLSSKEFVQVWCKISFKELPMVTMKFLNERSSVICYSRLKQNFYIFKRPDQRGVPQKIVQFKMENLYTEVPTVFGECSDYSFDKTSKYMVCVFG